jgi:GR25 family glycosyltransferase involved in LPS biosynthesis
MSSEAHLFVTINPNNSTVHGVKLIHHYMEQFKNNSIVTTFIDDAQNINGIGNINYDNFDKILIDALIFNKFLCKIPNEDLISFITDIPNTKYFLYHDLHYWSLGAPINLNDKDLTKKNDHYYNNLKLIESIGVKYIIAYYNCPELHDIIRNTSSFITKVYVVDHGFNPNIFKSINISKSQNVLLYGATTDYIYPLRSRLATLITKLQNTVIIPNNMDYNEAIKEEALCLEINKAWLTVATVSKFSYLVRKYFEIIASKSCIIGNINDQGLRIFKYFIYIDEHYDDDFVKGIIEYYLNNKEIIAYLILRSQQDINKYTYDKFATRIRNILDFSDSSERDQVNQEIYTGSKYFYYKKIRHISQDNINLKKLNKEDSISDTNHIYYLGSHGRPSIVKSDITGRSINNYDIRAFKIIDQIYVANYLKYFKYNLLKLNYQEYKNIYTPSLFYGIDNETIEAIYQHRSTIILIWTGGDVTNIPKKFLDYVLSNKDSIFHIAISYSISKALTAKKIIHIMFPFAPKYDYVKFNSYLPETSIPITNIEGSINHNNNNIFTYTSFNYLTYDYQMIQKIKEKVGGKFNIIMSCSKENYEVGIRNRDKLINAFGEEMYQNIKNNIVIIDNDKICDVYNTCFIGLRLTKLDGNSSVVNEMGLMGIRTICNSIKSPCTMPYRENDIDNIVLLIENEWEQYCKNQDNSQIKKMRLHNEMVKFLDIPLMFYNELYLQYNINIYFDHIYVLNLERSTERRTVMEDRLFRAGITNYEFFSALDGSNDNLLHEWLEYSKIPFDESEKKLGRKLIENSRVLANLYSVRNIIIDAKHKHYNNFLFLEDDVIFHKDFNKIFCETIFRIPEEWKLIYLGNSENNFANKSVVDNYYQPDKYSCGGFAWAIQSQIYTDLIEQCDRRIAPFDSGPLLSIKEKYPHECFSIYPNIIIADVRDSLLRCKRDMTSFSKINKWNIDNFEEF